MDKPQPTTGGQPPLKPLTAFRPNLSGKPGTPPGARGPLKPTKKGPPAPVKTIVPPPPVHQLTFMQAFLLAGAVSGVIGFLIIGGTIYLTTPRPTAKAVAHAENYTTLQQDNSTSFRSFRSMGGGPGASWGGSAYSSAIGRNQSDVTLKNSSTDNHTRTTDISEPPAVRENAKEVNRLEPAGKNTSSTKEYKDGEQIGH